MNKIIKTLSAVALALSLTSCLDLEPQAQMADPNLWKTAKDFQSFANMFYSWTPSMQSIAKDNDKNSDFMVDKGAMNTISNGTNTVPNSDGNYTGSYDHIRRCNLLIEKAAGFGNQADIAKPLGEAYFFRAYSYYTLLRLYGDAIIVTSTLDVTSPELYAKRNPRGEVADLILADLDKAAELLPSVKDVEAGYVGTETASAFKARVALFEGTWQKSRGNGERAKALLDQAAKAAKAVIDSKQFSLFKPAELGTNAYKYLFILEDVKSNPAGITKSGNQEFIWSRRYNDDVTIGFNITTECLANAQLVSHKIADLYLCSDGLPINVSPLFKGYDTMASEWQNRDNRMSNALCRPGDSFWKGDDPNGGRDYTSGDDARKYLNNFAPGSGTGYFGQKWACERQVRTGQETYDLPLIRYAEVLLAYAEAVFERDEAISDEDLEISLNLVRRRVNPNMPKLTNAFVAANGLDMRTEIRRERSVEFYGEGFRLDDLRRWKTAEFEMPQDFVGVHVTGTEFGRRNFPASRVDSQGRVIWESGRIWNDRNYLFPLPVDQMQLNPNLVQNPGWAS